MEIFSVYDWQFEKPISYIDWINQKNRLLKLLKVQLWKDLIWSNETENYELFEIVDADRKKLFDGSILDKRPYHIPGPYDISSVT